MIAALEVFDSITVYDNSFVAKLMATHPAIMSRIGALEDGEIARQKIGRLFVATPFAADNAAHLGGNSEVMRLSSVLIIAGVVWCSLAAVTKVDKQTGLHKSSGMNVAATGAGTKHVTKHKKAKPHDNMAHVTNVTNVNAKEYSITYKLPSGGTNTIYKHVVPPSDIMTPEQLTGLP